jgi:hypothetical protein
VIESNPEFWDHWVDHLGGSTGAFVRRLASGGLKAAQGEVPETNEVPFLRKVYGRPSDYIIRQDFRRFQTEADTHRGRIRYYESQGQADKAEEVRREHGALLGLQEQMKVADSESEELYRRSDMLASLPADRAGRERVLADLRNQQAQPSSQRELGADVLRQLVLDVERSLSMPASDLDQWTDELRREQRRILANMNRRIRQETGRPMRPVPAPN